MDAVDKTRIITQGRSGGKYERARQLRQEGTPAEAALWERLRTGRLHGLRFRRQQVIDGFIADFYCHAAGLVIEVDGAVHEERGEADTERDAILSGRNLKVLRFTNARIRDEIEAVLAEILTAALERLETHSLSA
jgi:very-short-patch-repair endonuclease